MSALGRSVVNRFKQGSWNTISVDLSQNSMADMNVLLKSNQSLEANVKSVADRLQKECFTVDALINTAGSWDGAPIPSEEYFAGVERMYKANTEPVLACT
jgi:NADP-dependent 3-hydroxy acid dehydrogenase YdfG